MRPRIRKITACLLLTAWPLVLGLATVWHTHSDGVHGAETSNCGHHHAHTHSHHHGHHHASHADCESERPGENSTNFPPHNSEECHSCQLLALSGVAIPTLPILPSLPLGETTDFTDFSLWELEAPNCFHLRGPPASEMV